MLTGADSSLTQKLLAWGVPSAGMYDSLLEAGIEIGTILLYAAGSVLLTAIGVGAEYDSLQNATAGHMTLAVWFAVMGAVAIAAGAKLGYEKLLLPRLA